MPKTVSQGMTLSVLVLRSQNSKDVLCGQYGEDSEVRRYTKGGAGYDDYIFFRLRVEVTARKVPCFFSRYTTTVAEVAPALLVKMSL